MGVVESRAPMHGPLEQQFARYRRTGDPELLGAVFDRAAPRLLRLAIQLAGEPNAAEDLVQETFLTAIERAGRYDPGKPLLPWLTGILANQARRSRRERGREPDPERLGPRPVPGTPLEEAERAELEAALARFAAELPEPYREPVVLRLRYGLAPAAIADALERSPGTVRVQLHRGLELLRRTLPAGLGAALAATLSLGAGRQGLAAVRAAVLTRAPEVLGAPAAGAAALAGGLIAVKKSWIVLAALLLFLGWAWWAELVPGALRGPRPGAAPAGSAVEGPAGGRPAGAAAAAAAPAATAGSRAGGRSPAPPVPEPAAAALAGRVVDGEGGAPLAGVELVLYPARRASWREVLARWPDQRRQRLFDGDQRFDQEWPLVAGVRRSTRLDPDAAHPVYDPPLPGTEALARTASDAGGRFRFERAGGDPVDGVLVCRLAGYGTRYVPLPAGSGPELVLELQPERALTGHLVDAQGRRLALRMRLAFEDRGSEPGAGQWPVETAADGSFAARVPSRAVAARSLTPSWRLVTEGGRAVLHPGSEPGPVELVVEPVARALLRVVADESGEPIESFFLVARDQYDNLLLHGDYHAPGGVLSLTSHETRGEDWTPDLDFEAALPERSLELVVWAEGRAPERLTVPRPGEGFELEARLAVGSAEALAGTVLEGGAPVAGARVEIYAIHGSTGPGDFHDRPLRAPVTGARGRFAAALVPGDYALRVLAGERVFPFHAGTLEAGRTRELTIDLAHFGELAARVEDERGRPLAGRGVYFRDAGRVFFFSAVTGDEGLARSGVLPAGTWEVVCRAPGLPEGAARREVELPPGGHSELVFAVPTPGAPVYARLVVEGSAGAPDLASWRARDLAVRPSPWTPLEADGTVPLDVQAGSRALQVAAPDGRRWTFAVPPGPAPGHALVLRLGGPSYDGRAEDYHTGAPLAGLRVFAVTAEGRASAVSDAFGRFRLEGLDGKPLALELALDPESATGSAYGFEDLGAEPAAGGAPLLLRVPRLDEAVLGLTVHRGLVRDAATGEPLPGAYVMVQSLYPQEHGRIGIQHDRAYTRAGPDGRYRLEAWTAPVYRAQVVLEGGRRTRAEWNSAGGAEEQRDFELP